MIRAWLYDPNRTFDENYDNGPYDIDSHDFRDKTEPTYRFLGKKINFPFGIAAGSLPTSRHTDAAFRLGYDVVVYKTQRSVPFPVNQFPNVLPVDVDGDLTPEKLAGQLTARDDYPAAIDQLSITNSFGVPSRGPSVWRDDLARAVRGAGDGQLLIASVVGTIREGLSADDYYQDFAFAAEQAVSAGAEAIEVNLSCPNVASEGVICYSEDAVDEICRRTKAAIGDTPLIIKVGYYSPQQQDLLKRIVARVVKYVAAISSINTLAAEIVDKNGNQALPGIGRLKSGVCGAGIKWAGLDMVRRLDEIRKTNGYDYEIIGVGGVMTSSDFDDYRAAGADVVQAVTAPMWNQYLALEIKQHDHGK